MMVFCLVSDIGNCEKKIGVLPTGVKRTHTYWSQVQMLYH